MQCTNHFFLTWVCLVWVPRPDSMGGLSCMLLQPPNPCTELADSNMLFRCVQMEGPMSTLGDRGRVACRSIHGRTV